MKKISLNNLNLKEVEQLCRDQLRGLVGGHTGSNDGSSQEDCRDSCSTAGDSCTTTECRTGTCKYDLGYLRCVSN